MRLHALGRHATRWHKSSIYLLAFTALIGVVSCTAAPQRRDWSTYTGPGAEYFRKAEYKIPYVADPLEPMNRVVWAANDFFLFDLLEPVSSAWRFVVPQTVRSHLVNFIHNFLAPLRAVNHLLQGDSPAAGHETHRFVINSTVGVLGLFDRAADRGIMPFKEDEDLGRTFVRWGWEDSTYLMLPVAGPSTVRDGVGRAGDFFLDPFSYNLYTALAERFIWHSETISAAKRLARGMYDAYDFERYGWSIYRWLGSGQFQEVEEDGPAVQSLRAQFFGPDDPWFVSRGRCRTVRIPSTNRKLPYDAWMQAHPAPVVFILPGMGAHRRSDRTIALAEMVYGQGFSAVTMSSAMNFEFMENAATDEIPGVATIDASDVHEALDAIWHDLEKKFPGRMTGRALMGLSLGAFHGLYIAAETTRPDNRLVDFDRYVLLDTPVSLRHAAEQLDAYYNAPLTFPEEQRDDHVRAILHRAGLSLLSSNVTEDDEVPFSEVEAQFLVGLSFRISLHDIIWSTQRRLNMGVLATPLNPMHRAPATDEILDYSFMEYFYAFVWPYYLDLERGFSSVQRMFDLSDARSLRGSLPTDGRVRIFVNANDFLLTPEDIQWLIDTLGESHVTVRPSGGHAGSLHLGETQQQIMDSLLDLLNAPAQGDP